MNRDPIKEKGGANLYGFVYNDPYGWLDYLGREPRGNRIRIERDRTNRDNRQDKKDTEKTQKIADSANVKVPEPVTPDWGTINWDDLTNILDDIYTGTGEVLLSKTAEMAGKSQCDTAFKNSGLAKGCGCCRFSVKTWKMLIGGADPIQNSALSGAVQMRKEPASSCVPPAPLPPGTPTISPAPGLGQYDIEYRPYVVPY